MYKYYIFASDPHGTGEKWIEKVQMARIQYNNSKVIFGGDYIDGRKYSKQTVFFIKALQAFGAIALRGNHEQLMLNAINSIYNDPYGEDTSLWAMNGYKSTIRSFLNRNWAFPKNIKFFAREETDFINWANNLPLSYETENLFFVHAGVDWEKHSPIKNTSDYDKLWIRDSYIYSHDNIFAHNTTSKNIVTGHTPTCLITGDLDTGQHIELPESCPVLKIQYKNEPARIFTDGGCHSSLEDNNGNVIVLDTKGNLVDSL